MIKEKLKEMQISLIELFSIITFLTFTYSLLVKYSFYSALGMKWLVNTLSPQFIILNSIKTLIIMFFSIAIGLIIIHICDTFKKIMYFLITIITLTTLYLGYTFYNITSHGIKSVILSSFLIGDFLVLFFTIILIIILKYVHSNRFMLIDSYNTEQIHKTIPIINLKINIQVILLLLTIINISLSFLAFIYAPIFKGNEDAFKILNYKENVLNLVVLKNSQEKWFLIEMVGDKAYLISEKDNNIKIIEYKDIEYIKQIPESP